MQSKQRVNWNNILIEISTFAFSKAHYVTKRAIGHEIAYRLPPNRTFTRFGIAAGAR